MDSAYMSVFPVVLEKKDRKKKDSKGVSFEPTHPELLVKKLGNLLIILLSLTPTHFIHVSQKMKFSQFGKYF